jgi:hypothetical protein
MEHLVALHRRPLGRLEQGPDVVEEVGGQLALGRGVERRQRRRRRLGHDRLLVVDGSVEPVDLTGGLRLECQEARPMRRQQAATRFGIGAEDGVNLGQAEIELAQPRDQPRLVELRPGVGPIRARGVDPGRLEQPELVVVAQRANAEPAQPPESSDREQVVINRPQHGTSGRSRVKCLGVAAVRAWVCRTVAGKWRISRRR